MQLPPAPWETPGAASGDRVATSKGLDLLVVALSQQRNSRELGLQLRLGLRDAAAEFSYVRMRGLRRLMKAVDASASLEEWGSLFKESQLYPQLQIVRVLFTKSLASSGGSFRQTSEVAWQGSSDEELNVGLRLLEGCCILDPSSRSIAARHFAVKLVQELLDRVDSPGISVSTQACCLDALLATLIDCQPSLQNFVDCRGVAQLGRMIKNRHGHLFTRLKCAEFLQLLVDHVLPSSGGYAEEDCPALSREQALQEVGASLGSAVAGLLRGGFTTPAVAPWSSPEPENLRARAQLIMDSVK